MINEQYDDLVIAKKFWVLTYGMSNRADAWFNGRWHDNQLEGNEVWCIVALAWQLFEDKPLVLLSNRDEFLQRPTRALHEWQLPNGKIIALARCANGALGWVSILCMGAGGKQILNYRDYQKISLSLPPPRSINPWLFKWWVVAASFRKTNWFALLRWV